MQKRKVLVLFHVEQWYMFKRFYFGAYTNVFKRKCILVWLQVVALGPVLLID